MTSDSELPTLSVLTLEPEKPSKSWHPKLTPYRLLVLSTTIGLGTAKTITATWESTPTSVTLEWISGVVVYLILQSLSTYDGPGSIPPALLSWMFTIDCMDTVWRCLQVFSMPRPIYDSEETLELVPHPIDFYDKWSPPITLYRLLVCAMVSSFGLAKGLLAYLGHDKAAGWVDWAACVGVGTLLYCVGLYEKNSARMWEGFFVTDYTSELSFAGRTLGLGIAVLLCAAWIILCMFLARYAILLEWNDERAPPDVPSAFRERSLMAYVQDRSIRIVLAACALYAMAWGAFVFRACMRSLRGVVGGRFTVRYRWFGALRARVHGMTEGLSAAVSTVFARREIRWKTILLVFLHIALHLVGIIFVTAHGLFYLGFAFPALERDVGLYAYPLWLVFTAGSLSMAGISAMFAWWIGRHMVRPWILYRSARRAEWERTLLAMW